MGGKFTQEELIELIKSQEKDFLITVELQEGDEEDGES